MDPNLPNNLDPKLKAAYDRVMGGPASAPSGQTPPAGGSIATPPQPQTIQPPQVSPALPPQNFNSTPVPPPAQTVDPTVAPVAPSTDTTIGSTIAFNANNAQKNQGTVAVKKSGSKIMTVLLGLGLIVLLVAYTFVWIYVFKLQIPFLPKF